MTKFLDRKLVYNLIRRSDIILEILDGRFPDLSRVKTFEKYIDERKIPLILVMNKCDLIPLVVLEQNKKKLSKEYPTVYVSARDRLGTKILRNEIQQISRGKEVIVSLIGIPNTGKSSILNALRGKHTAPTGAHPGFTKSEQLIRISKKILIYDSPGVVQVDSDDEDTLAFLGAFPLEKLYDTIGTASYFIEKIKKNYSQGFISRYQLYKEEIESKSSEEILQLIAKNRNIVKKKNILDIEKTARIVMREFVQGTFPYWEKIN